MPSVTVHQLKSENGNAYLNTEELPGRVTVNTYMGGDDKIVFACWQGNNFWLHVFDNYDWAIEFFTYDETDYDRIERIEPREDQDAV
jgi:hypothetical protein